MTTSDARPAPRIDAGRLRASLRQLGRVGSYLDPATGLEGVNRLSLTDADAEARRLVTGWMEAAGLTVRVDAIGNTFGHRPGRDPDAAPVLIGSHIDSVATAGIFDGCLGVLGGLEVVRALDEAGVATARPIEVAFFTEEEGVRFETDMLGSAVRAGRIALTDALALTDRDGVTLGSELDRHGCRGPHPVDGPPPHAYVECHIEQGPVLARAGMDLGVVTGVQAISWQEVTIRGTPAHAGTTPMELRRDAGVAAARLTLHLHELAASGAVPGLRATVGRHDTSPNLANVVPQRVVATMDLRHPDDARLDRVEQDVERYLGHLAAELGVEITTRRLVRTRAVAFDDHVREVIGSRVEEAGYRSIPILSGAGHDAQEMATLCPAGMIFVPGLHDGISHNPREESTPEACANGVDALLRTVLALADG
ncbi:MAG: M20 family metallo-hydrolase [Acidimicrobiia bacterium]|nr:M20 family metallo-hydrolase [Acidimicrobiia bacterium]